MLHKNFPLDLEGYPEFIDKLPKFIVHFSDITKKYVNNISEALTFADENGLHISSYIPVKFDDNIYQNAEAFTYEMQNNIQTLLFALHGQRDYSSGYELEFYSIISILNSMTEKINEIKSKFETNFELLKHFNLQLEEMKGGK
ncbi:MAG TPA: hypothetical protein PKE38_12245 [Ignavibacteriaceae bacterium]|nr:hypothetical protein [Ignavibacteriaceae bacterium]